MSEIVGLCFGRRQCRLLKPQTSQPPKSRRRVVIRWPCTPGKKYQRVTFLYRCFNHPALPRGKIGKTIQEKSRCIVLRWKKLCDSFEQVFFVIEGVCVQETLVAIV